MLRHHRHSSFNDDAYFRDKMGIYEEGFACIYSFCISNFFINFFPSF